MPTLFTALSISGRLMSVANIKKGSALPPFEPKNAWPRRPQSQTDGLEQSFVIVAVMRISRALLSIVIVSDSPLITVSFGIVFPFVAGTAAIAMTIIVAITAATVKLFSHRFWIHDSFHNILLREGRLK